MVDVGVVRCEGMMANSGSPSVRPDGEEDAAGVNAPGALSHSEQGVDLDLVAGEVVRRHKPADGAVDGAWAGMTSTQGTRPHGSKEMRQTGPVNSLPGIVRAKGATSKTRHQAGPKLEDGSPLSQGREVHRR